MHLLRDGIVKPCHLEGAEVFMKKKYRIIWGVIWLLAMLAFYFWVGSVGIFMGIMGTDSCHGVEGYAIVYLFFIWPAILCLAALIPPTLFFFRASALVVVLTLVGGLLVSVASFFLYMPILEMACKPLK